MVEVHHWNWCFRRDPSNFAPEIFIKHEIAHDDNVTVAHPVKEGFSVYPCYHFALILPLNYAPRICPTLARNTR
jgi:hypothetical protein